MGNISSVTEKPRKVRTSAALGGAFGAAVGVSIGVVLYNLALAAGLGLAFGVAFYLLMARSAEEQDAEDSGDPGSNSE